MIGNMSMSFASGSPTTTDPATAVMHEVHLDRREINSKKNYPDNFIRTSKYTLFTFLPLNLYEQFRKVANLYFLLNMIIALIPGASPITPVTAVLPLMFVVAVASIKDAYEDWCRHKADTAANNMKCTVIRDGAATEVPSKDVQVGDVLYIENGEEIRADCILLSSSLPEGIAYIDTAQLDGETNVKSRKARSALTSSNYLTHASLKDAPVVAVIEENKPSLVQWKGVLMCDGVKVPQGIEQFMYRGAVLRNTEWAYGLVAYAGIHTKLFLNLKQKPPKFSYMDHTLNRLILGIFSVKHVFLFVLSGMAIWWTESSDNQYAWYLNDRLTEVTGAAIFGWRYMTYFILLSYMIPISLFVTLELCKAMQAVLMSWDNEMRYVTPCGKEQHCVFKT
eukprot:PhM_4_TR13946/c0_g1_i6/m.5260/K14802/DRS2, ATP8A; phospholipid-transporting ATPase